ncbi:MAG: phosphonate metabolism transcriptional regulator PhnF [Variovorax sp.]|nr:phosphonate metabolism transcriptional regulator PhnF [Variovorax sp.]
MTTPTPSSDISGPALAAASSDLRRWELIADALRADITAGRLAPGQRLPNEQLLAQRFDVNRHTLRQAMQALMREGFVQVRHGAGTFVRELVLDYALQRRTRLTESVADAGERAAREILEHQEAEAAPWSKELRVPSKSRVIVLTTLASVRGRPVGLSIGAYPLPRFEGLAERVAELGSFTPALEALGVRDYTRAKSVVSARLPTTQEADRLARSAGQPVLVVNSVDVDAQGTPIRSGITLFAADAVQLTVRPDEGSKA